VTAKAGLTPEEVEIAKTYPGLLDLSQAQIMTLYRDDHSLFHGESKRLRRLERYLKEFTSKRERMGYSPQQMHEDTLMAFHDFFVNDVKRKNCITMPMYEGASKEDLIAFAGRFLDAAKPVSNGYF